YLDNALNFLMASNDGIERASASGGCKVDTHLVNGGGLRVLGITLMRCARLTEHLNGLCANLLQVNSQAFEHASCDTFAFTYEPEKEMLCADIVVLEALGFLLGEA